MTKKEYEDKCLKFEKQEMYDGRGEYNGYVCGKCGYITATFYKDKGVTPFIIACPKCDSAAMHKITSSTPPPESDNISKVRNFIRPAYEDFIRLGKATQEHILNGGLVFEDD